MIQSSDHGREPARHCAVIIPFRPAPRRSAVLSGRASHPVTDPDIVELAKEPGLPDRLRDLLDG
jgi:hypothetical protein